MSEGATIGDLLLPVSNGFALTFVLGLGLYAAGVICGLAGAPDEYFIELGLALASVWPLCAVITTCFVIAVFVKEVVVETIYVYRLRRRRRRNGSTNPETTPLITAGELPVCEPRRHAQPAFGYLAILVDAASVTDVKRGVLVGDLPREPVQLPVESISHVAVLSWRWDFVRDAFAESSRNLAAAIRYAQSAGIRYLFADIISLDQTLEARDLIQRVLEFSMLYKTIPVIAAYDQARFDMYAIMFRPWIFSETRLLMQNPTKIVYVGHNRQGAYIRSSSFSYFLGRLPRSRMKDTNFARQLRVSWKSDFVTSVLQVLSGTVNMAKIFDFKFIIPVCADVFTVAERLDRNDYLLTVALLANASRYGDDPKQRVTDTFTKLHYKQYRIESRIRKELCEGAGYGEDEEDHFWTEYHETQTIFLK